MVIHATAICINAIARCVSVLSSLHSIHNSARVKAVPSTGAWVSDTFIMHERVGEGELLYSSLMHVRSNCSCVMIVSNILITALTKIITVTPREARVRGVLFIHLSQHRHQELHTHSFLASRHVTNNCVKWTQRDLCEVPMAKILFSDIWQSLEF